jgi:hypothetical protein
MSVASAVAPQNGGVTRWRWPLAFVAAAVVLALIGVWTAVRPVSHAVQGQRSATGMPFAGWLQSGTNWCSVTIVSEFMAITAEHCRVTGAALRLGVSTLSTAGHVYPVKEFRSHPTLDVQAIFLRDRSGLTVTQMQERVDQGVFFAWGFGRDVSNNRTRHLTRAEFSRSQLCPQELPADGGSMCWDTTRRNSVCTGDSGGPVTQNGAIIAMMTSVVHSDGPRDCSTVAMVQAITIQQMQPWLSQMIDDANPIPT